MTNERLGQMKAHLTTAFLLGSLIAGSAQGVINMDNEASPYGLAVNAPGSANWYSGAFGMEVWELNGTTVPAGVNLDPAPGSGVRGYEAMAAAGFAKEAAYVSQATAGPGGFELGELILNHVSPPGATVVLALATWNTGASSWSAMLATATPATRAGILAFVQPTSTPDGGAPPVPPVLAMDQDLVMTAIPEPCVAALAGLGGAVLLLARRFPQRRRACSAGFQACRAAGFQVARLSLAPAPGGFGTRRYCRLGSLRHGSPMKGPGEERVVVRMRR
jgi:hypothetical protein